MTKVSLKLMDFVQRSTGGSKQFGYLALTDHDDLPEGHEIRLHPVEAGYEVVHHDETGSQTGEVGHTAFEDPDGILATAETLSGVEKAIEGALEIAENMIEDIKNNNNN